MRSKWFEFKLWNGEGCMYVEDDNAIRAIKNVIKARKQKYKVVGFTVNLPF